MKDEHRIGPPRPDKVVFRTEVEGTVSQYLLDPRGEVDRIVAGRPHRDQIPAASRTGAGTGD